MVNSSQSLREVRSNDVDSPLNSSLDVLRVRYTALDTGGSVSCGLLNRCGRVLYRRGGTLRSLVGLRGEVLSGLARAVSCVSRGLLYGRGGLLRSVVDFGNEVVSGLARTLSCIGGEYFGVVEVGPQVRDDGLVEGSGGGENGLRRI